MLVSLDTVYQLRLFGHADSYQMENVFFYRKTAGSGGAVELALAFESDVLEDIIPLQVNQAVWDGVDVLNLGDYDDFIKVPLATTGTYGDVPREPMWVGIGYGLVLNTRAVKQGSKRFAGIPSEISNEEEITSTGYIALMETLRVSLGQTLVNAGNTFEPVVVKRTKTVIAGTVPLRYKYALPVPPATEAEVGTVVEVKDTVVLTSQVSRKK